ncbi:MAG: hypothetical protein LAT83_03760 [Kiritimatiellae bacterium]|nr:hypothetical protein [Kiritimatiellia bacterium]
MLDRNDASFAIVSIITFMIMLISLCVLLVTWRESVHYRKLCHPDNLLAYWTYDPREIPGGPGKALVARVSPPKKLFALISKNGTYVSYTKTRQYGSWAFPKRLEEVSIQEIKGRPHLFFEISEPSMAGGVYMRVTVESSRGILIPAGKADEAEALIAFLRTQ